MRRVALRDLCSSCHRHECEPHRSCFAAFVGSLPEPTAALLRAIDAEMIAKTIDAPRGDELCSCCHSAVCADPQACLDEFQYALEYVGAPKSEECPTPGACKCFLNHDSLTSHLP